MARTSRAHPHLQLVGQEQQGGQRKKKKKRPHPVELILQLDKLGPRLRQERITHQRDEQQLERQTMTRLAEDTGVDLAQIHRAEHGENYPELPALVRLADFLGASLDYLAARTDRDWSVLYGIWKDRRMTKEKRAEVIATAEQIVREKRSKNECEAA